jgi:hypothetical protein
MPYRFRVEKLTFKETALHFGLCVGLVLLAVGLAAAGGWLGGKDLSSVSESVAFTWRAYLAILLFGAAGSAVGLAGMMLESVMNQMGCSLAILGIVFVVLLICLPAAVVICLIVLFNGGFPPSWLM